jgi:hypothetical protein
MDLDTRPNERPVDQGVYSASAHIDDAVTAIAVRVIWKALCAYDPTLKGLLQDGLNEEIQGLELQQELNGGEEDHQTTAIIKILSTLT